MPPTPGQRGPSAPPQRSAAPTHASGACVCEPHGPDAAPAAPAREAPHDALFDDAPVGLAVVDARSEAFTRVNRRFCEILGCARAAPHAHAFAELWSGDAPSPAEVAAQLRELEARHEGRLAFEDGFTRPDGARLRLRVVVSRTSRARVGVAESIAVLEDATRERAAAQALDDAELQLRALQKMEPIGRLAGGLAHDLNNLLGVIISYSDLAHLESHVGAVTRRDFEEIGKAARRAVELTRRLLAFSRRQESKREPVDLNELVTEVSRMAERLLGDRIALEVVASRRPALTVGDAGQIEQVLMNLVVNARDAMPDGGRLTIRTTHVALDAAQATPLGLVPGHYAEVAVEDTGCGMDEATRARIFEPFFTTKPVGEGTGLGLSIAQGIVRQCGGGLSVRSEVGRGTTFRVHFPADAPGPVSLAPTSASARPKVLVVDDEEGVRRVVSRILESGGCQVTLADGGPEGLDACTAEGATFDLVLLDVAMPGLSGPELAARLEWVLPEARVVFMSGFGEAALAAHAIAGRPMLRKPFSAEALLAIVPGVTSERAPC